MLKTSANKNVFKCLLKVAGVDWRWMCSGRRFQAAGPAYAKARSPNFESVCCTKSNSPCTHQRPVYQLCIIRCSTIIAFGVWTFRGSLTFIWRNSLPETFVSCNLRFLEVGTFTFWERSFQNAKYLKFSRLSAGSECSIELLFPGAKVLWNESSRNERYPCYFRSPKSP